MQFKESIDLKEYFISNKNYEVIKTNFLKDYKKKIKHVVDCHDDYFHERIYENSSSTIYYPNGNYSFGSKKNILLVSHELSRTGAPIVVLDTAKTLINNGYFVTVISLKNGPLLREFLDIGVPVIIMSDMKYTQYLMSEVSHFLSRMDLDLFVNSFDITFFVTATLYNFVRRYFNTTNRIYWWIHEGSESYNIIGSRIPKVVTPNIKVLCGGQYVAHQLEIRNYMYYPTVLNYGVFDRCKKIVYRDNKIITFLIAGTIGVRKGQLILLDAIKKLSNSELSKSKFIFIGDPYENDVAGYEIKKKIKEYSDEHDNVVLLSSISRDDLYKLYQSIDVLVLASIDDPMPVVATENFMFGNICLCSNATGTSYYIKDKENGFVFQSCNVDDLKDKLSYIIGHKDDLYEIKKKGRMIYDNYFRMEIFEKNIIKLIEGVMV